MATNVMQSLFGVTNPAQAQQEYMSNFMVSPAQLGQQGLLQQLVSLGGNAGAMIGSGAGRLLGGMTPQEAQQKQVQGLFGGASLTDADQLSQAAERFAQAGDVPRAQALMGQAQELRTAQDAQAEAVAKKQAEQQRLASLASLVQQKTGLSPEESLALAQDPAAVRELMKDENSFEKIDGRVKLVSKKTGETIKDLGKAGKSLEESLGTGLGILGATIAEGQAKRAGETGGAEVGKATATIQGKDDALIALQNASRLLKDDKGKYAIYSGFYGPSVTSAVKATGGFVGDRQKVVQTEKFLNEVRTTVIPLLAEFGGNDSNEELKFLQGIVGGDQTLEPESIDAILKSAQAKISRGIKRVQDQQSAVVQGRPLPTNTTSQGQPQTRRTSSGVTYTVVPQ